MQGQVKRPEVRPPKASLASAGFLPVTAALKQLAISTGMNMDLLDEQLYYCKTLKIATRMSNNTV